MLKYGKVDFLNLIFSFKVLLCCFFLYVIVVVVLIWFGLVNLGDF